MAWDLYITSSSDSNGCNTSYTSWHTIVIGSDLLPAGPRAFLLLRDLTEVSSPRAGHVNQLLFLPRAWSRTRSQEAEVWRDGRLEMVDIRVLRGARRGRLLFFFKLYANAIINGDKPWIVDTNFFYFWVYYVNISGLVIIRFEFKMERNTHN